MGTFTTPEGKVIEYGESDERQRRARAQAAEEDRRNRLAQGLGDLASEEDLTVGVSEEDLRSRPEAYWEGRMRPRFGQHLQGILNKGAQEQAELEAQAGGVVFRAPGSFGDADDDGAPY